MIRSLGDLLYKVGESLLSVSIKRALTGAGLGLATYAGATTLLEKLIADANATLQQGEGYVLSILGLGGVDTAISIILSATVIRFTITTSSVFLVSSTR